MKRIQNKFIESDLLPKFLFILSLCFLSFAYGYLAFARGWFPHSLIIDAKNFISEQISEPEYTFYYVDTDETINVPVYDKESAYTGLSLITAVIEENRLSASVINMDGKVVHSWNIDWFEIWPDATHLPRSVIPKSRPGTHIHGVVLLENGDLIFNFEYLGMVRLDVCGNVIWRLPYRTHHSIYLDEYGILWVPGLVIHTEPHPDLPNHIPPFKEPTVLKVSLDGDLLNEIFVFDIFVKNDLQGLLNLSSLGREEVNVSGDTLHLNDVETFPSYFKEGVFKAGDIMLSFRNINTVLIFREEDLHVTQISTGGFVRQHDPDFIDGNTISIFDNYNIGSENYDHQSRILIRSFEEEHQYIYYKGNEKDPFYTTIMGKNQWLPNGNLLITESMSGRAFEINPEGDIVWEYINIVDDGVAGIVEEAYRLSDSFTEDYFGELTKRCGIDRSSK